MMLEGNFGTPPEAMKEPIARITESAKLMALSIEDFLNVSRIESGNIKYECANFNLKTQVEHIVTDLQPEAEKKGLEISLRNSLTNDGFVFADLGKTQQILHNLINNALKYTPHGSITVHLYDNARTGMIYVDIADTGIGIAPEAIANLFQKFSRAKNANSVNISGTGLGLFVGRAMARAMNGDITTHSEGEGKGARFVFSIPANKIV
jgi:signal transduction histidine kinase